MRIKTTVNVQNKEKYKLSDVMRKINSSCLFILPLFKYGIKSSRVEQDTNYPFFLLSFAYGLKNTHLYADEQLSKDHLYLVVDKSIATEDKKLTSSEYDHFHNRMQNNTDCTCIYETEDEFVYKMKIPEKYADDIELIVQSQYSKTSQEYRTDVRIRNGTSEQLPCMPLANFIYKKEIGYCAANKMNPIWDMLRDEYGLDSTVVEQQEIYTQFERDSNFDEAGKHVEGKTTEFINLKNSTICQK